MFEQLDGSLSWKGACSLSHLLDAQCRAGCTRDLGEALRERERPSRSNIGASSEQIGTLEPEFSF